MKTRAEAAYAHLMGVHADYMDATYSGIAAAMAQQWGGQL